MGRWGRERREKGWKKEFRCVIYRYQLPTRNVNIIYYKHVLIKNKVFQT